MNNVSLRVDQEPALCSLRQNLQPLEQRIKRLVEGVRSNCFPSDDDCGPPSSYQYCLKDVERGFSKSDVTDRDAGLGPDPFGDLSDGK